MLMTAMPTRDDQANQLWVHNWDKPATDAVMAQGALASTLKTVARRRRKLCAAMPSRGARDGRRA
jgi:hypothetical protein